jgi:DNA-binding winged helix-turn-helix (wHTH) protein
MASETAFAPTGSAPDPPFVLLEQEEARRRRVVLCFEEFTLDAARFELTRRGRRVALAPQPYDLLWALASAGGAVVSRAEIRRVLWGSETFVDFDGGLNFTVRALRKALGDDARRPRYVESIRGAGYRFVAPVRVLARERSLPPA